MCPKAIRGGEATLVAFVAGKVRGPDGARLRAHLEDCERCRDYVEGQRAIWQLLDDWQPELQNTNFNSDFASRLAHLPPEPWFVEIGRRVAARMLKPAFTFSAIAAVLAVSVYVRNPFVASGHTQFVPRTVASAPRVISPVEAEQVDRAIDDMQLLHQLDSFSEVSKDPARSM